MLKDKIALVTGAGRGLGRAVALALSREGASVAAADRDGPGARDAARDTGGLAVEGDLADPGACGAMVETTVARYGRLDILVNCAAICLVDPLLEISPERWDRVFAVNVRGAFAITQAAARAMIPRRSGRILHVSSPASKLGTPMFASYAASKAAVDSLVRSAALALAPHLITVNSIVPGRMTGGMIDDLEAEIARRTGQPADALKEDRTRSLPFQRRVAPEEVARAAVWLASDPAAYVTAERFNFTGGMELA